MKKSVFKKSIVQKIELEPRIVNVPERKAKNGDVISKAHSYEQKRFKTIIHDKPLR